MNARTLLDNFDLIADAPGGVPKLRELILQLAVRGKLVPQDDGDRPRVFLSDVSSRIHYGFTASANSMIKDVRLLRITDIQDNKVQWETVPGCDIDIQDVPKYELNPGDILIARTGGTIGKTYLITEMPVRAVFASYLIRVIPSARVLPRFLKLFLESPDYWEQLRQKSAGTGQPNVNGQALGSLEFDLPPLPEQKRIVTKVDELMKRCDELETRQKERSAHHTTLVASCLNAVTTPNNSLPSVLSAGTSAKTEALAEEGSFNLLFTSPESIAELRKAILQLAVQGRLVKQELSACKNANEHESVNANLPLGWKRVMFSEIAETNGGVTKGRKLTGPTVTYPYLRVANVQRGVLDLSKIKEIEIAESELTRYALTSGDLLITEGGDWDKVGRMALWRGEISPCLHQNHVFRARLISKEVCHEWVLMYFNSAARDYFAQASKQTTNLASINMRQLRACPVSMPPLAEQKRIVVKVNELMDMCDKLEAKLTQSSAVAEKLAGAVVGAGCNNGNMYLADDKNW